MNQKIQHKKKFQTKAGIFLKKSSTKELPPIKTGDILTVRIHTVSSNQLGFSQQPNGYTIVVPTVNPKISVSDDVRVGIETVCSEKLKYATAKVLEISTKNQKNDENSELSVVSYIAKEGDILDVTISKEGPKGSGLVKFKDSEQILVIPKSKVGDKLTIQIVRVKNEYAIGIPQSGTLRKFGPISSRPSESKGKTEGAEGQNRFMQAQINQSNQKSIFTGSQNGKNKDVNALMQNSKFHLVLPKTAKLYRGYAIVKLNRFIIFIKLALGAKLGQTVRIETMKVGTNYAVARIIKISPLTRNEKFARTKTSVQQMIKTGIHFGEKAIRCNANMRKYVWYKKKGQNKNRPLLKKDRYYINVLKTRRCLKTALTQLAKYAAKGKTFLFVGTKKSAAALIARTALFTKTSFFVNTRWLGGMLTNWKTILKSISQIKPILKEKQKIIQNILEKRQKIKYKFINKVNLLRKRGQKLLARGQILIAKLRQNKNGLIEKSQQLIQQKQQILLKNKGFLTQYVKLKNKKREFIEKSQNLLQKGNSFLYQKQNLLKQFRKNQARLKEFKQLFLIGQELLKFKKTLNTDSKIWSISYGKFEQFSLAENQQQNMVSWMVPNPSKEMLDRIIYSMKMKYETPSSTLTNKQNRSKSNSLNTILVSKLLNRFTDFLPFMKIYIENIILRHENLQFLLKTIQKNIDLIQSQLQTVKEIYAKLIVQLGKLKKKLLNQQTTLKILRTKLKRLASEQRLLKFLPKLRYLPTEKTKMVETIQVLMKKFVDPKLTVPMEQIYESKFKFTSKKIAAARKQKWQRLEKYFGGITKMAKMNKKQISKNIAIIVGQQEEMNAVYECQKLGIKMFTLVDTNCNPKFSDHIIPVNDDSRNSVKFILQEMLTRIRLAQKLRQKLYSRKVYNF